MSDDLLPAYVALIRRELKLATGSNAIAELSARLHPADASERLPARAPGLTRLRKAERLLKRGRVPESALDEFAADLRFLQLFARDDEEMPREAMQKLLKDVMAAPPTKARVANSAKATASRGRKIVGFRESKVVKEDGRG